LQARQIEGDFLAEEIGARRQKLAELDEAWPQLAECRGEALARALLGTGGPAPENPTDVQEG
jgi:hypothetical protein